MAQNVVEKKTLQHLLKCIIHDLGPQEAAESGLAKGLVGVDKDIMKYGLVHRRAKTAYKKDERFLIVVPGKLLLFKGMDIVGKHVRFVTSLLGATTRLVYGQLEIEVIVPDSKSLNLLTLSAEELTDWIGAIEESALFANEDAGGSMSQNMQGARADRKKGPTYRNDQDSRYTVRRRKSEPSRDTKRGEIHGASMQDRHYPDRERDYEDGDNRHSKYQNRDDEYQGRENWNQERGGDRRNQIKDGYEGNYMESKGFRGNVRSFQQEIDRREVHRFNGYGQTSEANVQLPRRNSEQSGDRDQDKVFTYPKQSDESFDGVSNSYQELPGTLNQSANLAQSQWKRLSKQRSLDSSQFNATCLRSMEEGRADYGSGKGRSLVEDQESRDTLRMSEERSAGKAVGSRNDRGDADYLSRNVRENKAWESDYGPPVEANKRYTNDDFKSQKNRRKISDKSSPEGALVSHQLNQQLDRQLSLRSSMDLDSRKMRGSREDHNEMLAYMDLYRRGLYDSSTQTDY